jgi:hypothetical protein
MRMIVTSIGMVHENLSHHLQVVGVKGLGIDAHFQMHPSFYFFHFVVY